MRQRKIVSVVSLISIFGVYIDGIQGAKFGLFNINFIYIDMYLKNKYPYTVKPVFKIKL